MTHLLEKFLFRTHLNPPLQGRKLQPATAPLFLQNKYNLVIKQDDSQIAIFINQAPPFLPSLCEGRVGDGC